MTCKSNWTDFLPVFLRDLKLWPTRLVPGLKGNAEFQTSFPAQITGSPRRQSGPFCVCSVCQASLDDVEIKPGLACLQNIFETTGLGFETISLYFIMLLYKVKLRFVYMTAIKCKDSIYKTQPTVMLYKTQRSRYNCALRRISARYSLLSVILNKCYIMFISVWFPVFAFINQFVLRLTTFTNQLVAHNRPCWLWLNSQF